MKNAMKAAATGARNRSRSEGKAHASLNVARAGEYMTRTRTEFAAKMKVAESFSPKGALAGNTRKR